MEVDQDRRGKERENEEVVELDDVASSSSSSASSKESKKRSQTEIPSLPLSSSESDLKKKKKRKRVVWTLENVLSPRWWTRMCWQEKASIIYFTICFLVCVLMGTLVDGWHRFSWQAWYSIGITIFSFFLLVRVSWVDPSMVMLWSLTMLLAAQVITVKDSVSGFANASIITIAILFPIAESISQTGSLNYFSKYILTGSSSVTIAQAKVTIPNALVSGFINNTPQVMIMIPIVAEYCRNFDIPASKMMIPLSYANIVGGTLTIIGTSTNLVVVGLVQKTYPDFEFGFFELAKIGSIVCAIGIVYMLIFHRWLLPVRESPLSAVDKNPKNYLITMRVGVDKNTAKSLSQPQFSSTSSRIDVSRLDIISPRLDKMNTVSGKSIEEAGLRHLRGVFLTEIQRHHEIFGAPGPEFILQEGDLLLFAGDVRNVSDLLRVPGLIPSSEEGELLIDFNQILFEAVVASHSSLIGSTVAECKFREKYDAAIISIFRSGETVTGKIGDIELQIGDTLLMVGKKKNLAHTSGDFVFVAQVSETNIKFDPIKLVLAPLFSASMIAVASAELTDLLTASLLCLFAVYITGCITFEQIVGSVDMIVMVIIASSFAMAAALEYWGVARELASNLLAVTEFAGDYGVVLGSYLSTCILTALLSNAAASAIMVPIILNLFQETNVSLMGFAVTVMIAASADFCTPIGYQTNLMVWGPGGYKFLDYTRFGLPLQLILLFVCSLFIVIIYGE